MSDIEQHPTSTARSTDEPAPPARTGAWGRLLGLPLLPHQAEQRSSEEAEVRAIFARIERELPLLEERVNRLMQQYGL